MKVRIGDPNLSFESNDDYANYGTNINKLKSERDVYDTLIDKSIKSFRQDAF
jgi:hypothetical protein